ncbi:MAG: hypothetical protein KC441_07445 [Anaerolineales bacterium]|nr:hypothetical protein [Anaerolineales bacterium]
MNKGRMICTVGLSFVFLTLALSFPVKQTGAFSPEPLQEPQQVSTTISVTYVGDWDVEAQSAMEYAASIWETLVYSPVPIEIEASWGSSFMDTPADAFVVYVRSSALPNPNAYYPEALSNALQGKDNTGNADINIRFNSDFNNWYFGTDGQAPGSDYDFVTVALKYIGRGLGLRSGMSLCGPTDGCWGTDSNRVYPLIYDTLVVNGSGQHLTDTSIFPNPSPALKNELTSNNIYFAGAKATVANGGVMPKLYAPESWESIKYPLLLDDNAFPAGSVNALMSHTLETGEVIHNPGPLAQAMLFDLGWTSVPQAPVLQPLPSQLISVNTSRVNAIDLWNYVDDPDTLTADLTFTIVSVSPIQLGATLDNGRYISISPETNWIGTGQVTVEVEDTTNLVDSQSFDVIVEARIFLPMTLKP